MQGAFFSHLQIVCHFMKIRQFMSPVRFALYCLNIALQEIVLVNLNSLHLLLYRESKNRAKFEKKFIYSNIG